MSCIDQSYSVGTFYELTKLRESPALYRSILYKSICTLSLKLLVKIRFCRQYYSLLFKQRRIITCKILPHFITLPVCSTKDKGLITVCNVYLSEDIIFGQFFLLLSIAIHMGFKKVCSKSYGFIARDAGNFCFYNEHKLTDIL